LLVDLSLQEVKLGVLERPLHVSAGLLEVLSCLVLVKIRDHALSDLDLDAVLFDLAFEVVGCHFFGLGELFAEVLL
jgi:hypothetical protein